MKTLQLALLATLLIMNVSAQQPTKEDAFASLPLVEAEKFINSAEGHQTHLDCVASAFKARRLELIKLCFENQYTRLDAVRSAAVVDDASFRDEVVLMMLRSPSAYWPSDNPLTSSSRPLGGLLTEPFITTIKTRLPGIQMNDDVLATSASRSQLATKLAATIESPSPSPNNSSLAPDKQATASPNPLPLVQQPASKRAAEVKPTVATPSEEPTSSMPWSIIVVLIVAAIGLLWLVLKNRK
jgi:hypothetical protein